MAAEILYVSQHTALRGYAPLLGEFGGKIDSLLSAAGAFISTLTFTLGRSLGVRRGRGAEQGNTLARCCDFACAASGQAGRFGRAGARGWLGDVMVCRRVRNKKVQPPLSLSLAHLRSRGVNCYYGWLLCSRC